MALVLTVDGTDITDDVEFTKSNFIALVNGQPGTCSIVLRDPGRARSFTIGDRILLTIDGLNMWAGYLMRTRRIYPFAAHSPSGIRFFELIGLDLNVLFSKRIVFNQHNPVLTSPTYSAYTNDTTVLDDLFEDWIDIGGDNLDVTSLVSNVGTINEDQKAFPLRAGESWLATMRQIATLINPVWYLNPDRKLVWADQDVEDAPYTMTDAFSSEPEIRATQRGYREFRLTMDGTELINDALFIGAGNGAIGLVYKRVIDSPSQSLHGRWQTGGLVSGIYKQSSINRIANSYVYGSPQSRRGHKDDKVVAMLTTYDGGFRVGQKINLVSEAWGYDDVLPVRQMRITWPIATEPRYEMVLSHELDSPFSFFEWRWPIVNPLPKPIPPPIPGTLPGPGGTDPPKPPDWRDKLEFFVETGQANDVMEPNFDPLTNSFDEFIFYQPDEDGTQVLFETFNRADNGSAWGTSTDGHTWSQYNLQSNGFSEIDNLRGNETVPGPSWITRRWQTSFENRTNPNGAWSVSDWVLTWKWHSHYEITNPGGRAYWYRLGLRDPATDEEPWWIKVTWNGYGEGQVCDNFGNCTDVNVGPPGTENDGRSQVHLDDNTGGDSHQTCINETSCITGGGNGDDGGGGTGEETKTDSCCGDTQPPGGGGGTTPTALIIDNFNRSATGWGNTSGTNHAWAYSTPTDNITVSTTGSVGQITIANTYPWSTSKVVSLNEGGTNVSGGVTGTGVPHQLFESSMVNCSIDVMVEGSDGPYLELTLAEGADSAGAGLSLGMAYPETGFQPRLYLDSYDAIQQEWRPRSTIYFGLQLGTWYRVTFTVAGTSGMFSIIDLGDSANAAFGSIVVDPLPWSPGQFTIRCVGDLSEESHTFSFDNLTSGTSSGDTFEGRTLDGSWGQATGGGQWISYSEDPNNTLEVHDGSGFFGDDYNDNAQALPFTGATFLIEADIVWTWGTGSGRELMFGILQTGYNPYQVFDGYMTVWQSPINGVWKLDVEGNDIYSTSFTPTNGHLYTWRLTFDGTTLTGTILDEGTSVATASGSWSGATTTAVFFNCYSKYLGGDSPIEIRELRTSGSGGAGGAGWDEGGPCFWMDDFDRSVSGEWGAGSFGNSWSKTMPTGVTSGVSGGIASITVADTVASGLNGSQSLTGIGPWNDNPGFTWMGEFRVTDLHANAQDYWSITFGIDENVSSAFDRFHFTDTVLWDYNSSPGTNANFHVAEDVTYTFRWEYGFNGLTDTYAGNGTPGGVNRLKVWKSSLIEPRAWTIDAGTAWVWINSSSYPYISAISGGAGDQRGFSLEVLWTSFSRCASANPAPTRGWVCEDFMGGTTVYFLRNDYTFTTVTVYVNGKIETDFTEDGGNSVTLGFTTSRSDSIKICYLIAGSGSGWNDGGPGGGPFPT